MGRSPIKAINSLFIYVRTPLFQGGAALPPANPAISEPVFLIPFNGGLFNSCDSQPPLAYYFIYIYIIILYISIYIIYKGFRSAK